MMDILANGFHYLWSFVLILSVIVFIHEFGHYIVAKLCGVKIETFSIGFGKELFGINDRTGTRWKFSILPFGGYVKMFGDAGEASTPDDETLEKMTEAEKRVSFHYKPLWKKAIIVGAGPMFNFLLTIAIFTFFLYTTGMQSTEPVVGEVMEDTPAAAAGLKAGDRVLQVDEQEMETFTDISTAIVTNIGEPVTLDIQRGHDIIQLQLTPIQVEDEDAFGNVIKRPLIGIRSEAINFKDLTFFEAIGHAIDRTVTICVKTLEFLGQMIALERSADDLKGPIGIAKLSGQATQSGDTTDETLRTILWFIAMLSANLGLINLLPVPMLDGGHLAFYVIEAIQGKPLARQFQEYGFRVGLAIILCLMVFVTFNDIRQQFF